MSVCGVFHNSVKFAMEMQAITFSNFWLPKDRLETNVTLKWLLWLFLATFLPYVCFSFTKMRFRRSFWYAQPVWISIGSKAMVQKVAWGHAQPWLTHKKIATDKWPFYDNFWPFFHQLYVHLSQNWGSDGHFEVLTEPKS